MQLISGAANFAMRGFADAKIFMWIGRFAGKATASHALNIGGLGRICGIEPRLVRLSKVAHGAALKVIELRLRVDDDLGMDILGGLNHPAKEQRIIKSTTDPITTELVTPHGQFTRIWLPIRPDTVRHVLLDTAHPIGKNFGYDGNVSRGFELTAFIPYHQRARRRWPSSTVAK